MKISGLVALALGCFAASVAAQPFRCVVDGRAVYQQQRCDGGRQVNTSGAGKADPNSTESIKMRNDVEYIKWRDKVNEAIGRGRVMVGMTADDVVRSWGQPEKINRTLTANVTREQWVYRGPRIGSDQYVYVENGVVVTLQSP